MPEIIRKTAKKFLNDNGSIIEQNPEGAEKSTSFGVLFMLDVPKSYYLRKVPVIWLPARPVGWGKGGCMC